jgi:Mor family transcriptional regulator
MKRLLALILFFSLALSSCGSKETLLRKSAQAPQDLTLTGQWDLIEDIDVILRQFEHAIRQTSGSKKINATQRRSQRKAGGLVYVFLENGRSLKITQTDAGLFISFDRSVVDEYRFGEARMVSVGGADAQRVSGWEGEQYVIETLGEEGMKLTERYHLVENGSRLHRQVILRSKKGEKVISILTYNRKAD